MERSISNSLFPGRRFGDFANPHARAYEGVGGAMGKVKAIYLAQNNTSFERSDAGGGDAGELDADMGVELVEELDGDHGDLCSECLLPVENGRLLFTIVE